MAAMACIGWGIVERVMGIEPTLAAWEAAVLPLNYTRTGLLIVFSLAEERQMGLRDAPRPIRWRPFPSPGRPGGRIPGT